MAGQNPGGFSLRRDNAAERTASPRCHSSLTLGSWAEPSASPGKGVTGSAGGRENPCAGAGGGTVARQTPTHGSGAGGTQSPYCHLPRGAGRDPNIWPRRMSPASARAAGAGEQLVGGKVFFVPFWLPEKGALSSFRVLPIGLFSCLSSHGCCAIGLETKGARRKKAN